MLDEVDSRERVLERARDEDDVRVSVGLGSLGVPSPAPRDDPAPDRVSRGPIGDRVVVDPDAAAARRPRRSAGSAARRLSDLEDRHPRVRSRGEAERKLVLGRVFCRGELLGDALRRLADLVLPRVDEPVSRATGRRSGRRTRVRAATTSSSARLSRAPTVRR